MIVIFIKIGSDGALLEQPVQLNRVRLANGERAEIIIDFSENVDDTIYLMSYASELNQGEPGGTGGPAGTDLDGIDFNVLALIIRQPNGNAINALPTNLTTHEIWDENDAVITRPMVLNGPPNFSINGVAFDPLVINETIQLGNIEIWEIENPMGGPHPFHIHDVQFYLLDRNGTPPPLNERGKKDVVLVYGGETVRFITKFDDFADPDVPYMYHCHFLRHEDNGMMGQFIVVDTLTTALNSFDNSIKEISVYPNPVSTKTVLSYHLEVSNHVQITVFDILGKAVDFLLDQFQEVGRYQLTWEVEDLPNGTYLIQLKTESENISQIIHVFRK